MGKILVTVGLLVVCSMAGTLKDSRDGQTYKTVKIGNQVWMAENLNYKTGESKCYDNKESNCKKYGRLYTWEAAKMACPSVWHLPSRVEMETFIEAVKVRVEQIVTQKKLDAVPLREGEDVWHNHLRDASWREGFDSFGFSALPAGDYSIYLKKFIDLGYDSYFWSSTDFDSDFAYRLYILDYGARVSYDVKSYGISVRCLQDSNEGGEASSQRSEAQPPSGTLKDSRDGQTYKTVKIGNQVWMAENLNYKTSESKCYDNKDSNCKKYGRLYTWEAAQNACPSGWHLPSEDEFGTLLATVGASSGDGSNLRAASWENGADKFGFSTLPAGYYDSNSKEFYDLGSYARFWSSTEGDSYYAYRLDVSGGPASVIHGGKGYGISVRCLQDSN